MLSERGAKWVLIWMALMLVGGITVMIVGSTDPDPMRTVVSQR